jgi:prolactin regulatory element-binding protein
MISAGIPLIGLKVSSSYVLVSGGGGESKTGVPNQIVGLKINDGQLGEDVIKFDSGSLTFSDLDCHKSTFVGCSVDSCSTFKFDGEEIVEKFVFPLTRDESYVQKSARFSLSGTMAIAASDGNIGIWEGNNHEEYNMEKVFNVCEEGDEEGISKIEWIGDTRIAVMKKSSLGIWDIQSAECVAELKVKEGCRFNGLRVTADQKYIYLIQFEPRVASYLTKYDIANETEKSSLIDNRIHATAISISQNSDYIALGDAKGYLMVYKQNLSLFMKKKVHDFVVTNLELISLPTSDIILSCSLDENIALTQVAYNMKYTKNLLIAFSLLILITAILYTWLI